jgi:hypothetical protein
MKEIICQNITKKNIKKIMNDLKNILTYSEFFDIESIFPLGSSRLMLEGLGKQESKDLDLAIKIKKEYQETPLSELIESLEELLNQHNYELRYVNNKKIIFGNVITIYAYDTKGNTFQIDLMLAISDNISFNYLTELRFYNNEIDPDLKGLHRTELIRSMIKAKGLSLGTININQFRLKTDIKDNQDIFNKLKQKINRSRKKEIKKAWEDLYDYFEDLKVDLITYLFQQDKISGIYYLKSRYGFADKIIEQNCIDLIADKSPYLINNKIPYWKTIFENIYDTKDIYLSTTQDVLLFLEYNHTKEEKKYILKDYINELKKKTAGDFYNDTIKNLINQIK